MRKIEQKWIWKEGARKFNEKFMKNREKNKELRRKSNDFMPGNRNNGQISSKNPKFSMLWVGRLKFIYGGAGRKEKIQSVMEIK